MSKPSVTSITVTLAYCMATVQSIAFICCLWLCLVYSLNPPGHMSFVEHVKFKLQLTYHVKWQQLWLLQLSSNMVKTSYLEETKETNTNACLTTILHDQDFFLSWSDFSTLAGVEGYCYTWTYTRARQNSSREVSARRRDPYNTVHNTHKRQTPMPLSAFEPAIPASERPQTYTLDRAATWTKTAFDTHIWKVNAL
jgi:hypothetical protein